MSSQHGSLRSGQILDLLGLFPYFGPDAIGGAQLSGRLAWEGLRITALAGKAHLFAYGVPPDKQSRTVDATQVGLGKLTAARAALDLAARPNLVLIWHIGMVRLLPFFRPGRAKVALMLLGIEAWRRHDPLTRLLLRRVDQFLSISDHTWRGFLSFYPHLAARPHRTVYLGLDEPAVVLPALPAAPPAALIISRLARGEDYKGHRELINAWPLLQQKLPEAELWIAGDGDLRPELERLAHERGLAAVVRFFGQVSDVQKQDLLARSRCLAMPSRGEGFGLVYLEAMRLGRPCLVSTLDAGREVVNPPQAGLAADPADPQALAAALVRLLTCGTEWERWSAQAQQRYVNQFTAAHFQQRLVAALSEQK